MMQKTILNKLHNLLTKKGKTVAVAESCTGGLTASLLTQLSGSSQYFMLGVVSYSNQSKANVLKISPALIFKEGAVSNQVARNMSLSIRKKAKSDFGIGITGIAGPTGAAPGKPIGTVFIAIDSRNRKICKRYLFKGNRSSIRKQAAFKALSLLYSILT